MCIRDRFWRPFSPLVIHVVKKKFYNMLKGALKISRWITQKFHIRKIVVHMYSVLSLSLIRQISLPGQPRLSFWEKNRRFPSLSFSKNHALVFSTTYPKIHFFQKKKFSLDFQAWKFLQNSPFPWGFYVNDYQITISGWSGTNKPFGTFSENFYCMDGVLSLVITWTGFFVIFDSQKYLFFHSETPCK